MRVIISILLMVWFLSAKAQTADTSWFNKHWKPVAAGKADYCVLTTHDTAYHVFGYYLPEWTLQSVSHYPDKYKRLKQGPFTRYSRTGLMNDSLYFEQNKITYWVHFYEDGKKKNETWYNNKGFGYMTETHSLDKEGRESERDTFYFNKKFQLCMPDTAQTIQILTKEGNAWKVLMYSLTDSFNIVSYYKDRTCRQATRHHIYSYAGRLRDSIIYGDNGKCIEFRKFHANGTRAVLIRYDSSGKIKKEQSGFWNEEGKETALDFKVHVAEPEEGFKNWQRKLLKQINKDDSIDWKRRKDLYGSVYISFAVSDNGTMKDVFIQTPSLYPEMDQLILRYCLEDKLWKPCRVWGRREGFVGTHSFSFVAGKVIKYETLY